MDPLTANEMAAALAVFVAMIEKLGAGGIIGLLIGGPLLFVLVFWGHAWSERRHNQKMSEDSRAALWTLFEKHREETTRMREEHRKETSDIIKKFDDALQKVTRYYESNVMLVQDYQKLTGELQTLIVTTIQTLGRVDAHFEALCKTIKQ